MKRIFALQKELSSDVYGEVLGISFRFLVTSGYGFEPKPASRLPFVTLLQFVSSH